MPAAPQASLLLRGAQAMYRATGLQRGGGLLDKIPLRLLGGETVWTQTEAGELLLRVRDHGARDLLLRGRYSNEVEETRIVRTLFPNMVGMLDVGASYGWYTLLAVSLMAPGTTRVAVEANPDVFFCLSQAVARQAGTRALNVAATDKSAVIPFFCAESTGLSSAVREVGDEAVVQGMPVDAIWPADKPLDFVKCDVEGGELHVLRGARNTRARHAPIWMMEFNEALTVEAKVAPAELASEVAELQCWWRSDTEGWVRSENLGAVVGIPRRIKNVYLVPTHRANRFSSILVRSLL